MEIADFLKTLSSDFYTGVPDSKLKALCNYLTSEIGIGSHHIIAANEGNAVGLAAGYHLATGKVPVVYLQNSGIGNIMNPLCSLLNEKVYGIPCIFVVGWRGEPGVHDEPQHVFQGEVSETILRDLGCLTYVLTAENVEDVLKNNRDEIKRHLDQGGSVALLIKQGVLSYDNNPKYKNDFSMTRESILEKIVDCAKDGVIVSTTGKTSRELFEIRERNGQGHEKDFLTVGSMGHSSSIALGIALNKPQKRVWCIDGDGAALMHMGAMAVIGSNKPSNMVHVLINNQSHESVGGMPTVAGNVDMCEVAEACGYPNVYRAEEEEALIKTLSEVEKRHELCFIEVFSAIGSRADLGRPTTTPIENKNSFMKYLQR